MKVTAKNGLVKVEPFSTMLYGGALRTVLTADMRTDNHPLGPWTSNSPTWPWAPS